MESEKIRKGANSLDATENILWEELKKALSYFNEALLYTDRKRTWSRRVDTFMLCMGIAATLFRSLSPWISPVALVIMTAIVSCKSDILRFLQSEEELSKLDAIGMFYQNYFYDVEQLFFDLHYRRIDEEKAMERLRQLRKLEYGKEAEYSKYVRKCNKKDDEYIRQAIDRYYNNYIHTKDK
jgi:hypothetical protein